MKPGQLWRNSASGLWRSAASVPKLASKHSAVSPRVAAIFFMLLSALLPVSAHAQVTFERLLNSAKEPQNWLTYSGDYTGRRFSALDQVNTANAHTLTAKWVYQTGASGKIETTPLVVDGILYATAQDDRAFALDARTGRPIWMYQYPVPGIFAPAAGM